MGANRLGNRRRPKGSIGAGHDQLHWSGLPERGRQVAVFVLAAMVLVDVVVQYLTVSEAGWRALSGGRDLLGGWDLAQAAAASGALLVTARRARFRVMAVFGVLFATI